jgi:hypothetical protein
MFLLGIVMVPLGMLGVFFNLAHDVGYVIGGGRKKQVHPVSGFFLWGGLLLVVASLVLGVATH